MLAGRALATGTAAAWAALPARAGAFAGFAGALAAFAALATFCAALAACTTSACASATLATGTTLTTFAAGAFAGFAGALAAFTTLTAFRTAFATGAAATFVFVAFRGGGFGAIGNRRCFVSDGIIARRPEAMGISGACQCGREQDESKGQ